MMHMVPVAELPELNLDNLALLNPKLDDGPVAIGILVCIVIGVKRAVKRLRSRRECYRKIDTEADIMLDNLRYRDDPHHID